MISSYEPLYAELTSHYIFTCFMILFPSCTFSQIFFSQRDINHWIKFFISGCSCLVFSATYGKERGTFSSPDYPKSYPRGIDCLLYTFIAGPDEIIELTFTDFDVHKSYLEWVQTNLSQIILSLITKCGTSIMCDTPLSSHMCAMSE